MNFASMLRSRSPRFDCNRYSFLLGVFLEELLRWKHESERAADPAPVSKSRKMDSIGAGKRFRETLQNIDCLEKGRPDRGLRPPSRWMGGAPPICYSIR